MKTPEEIDRFLGGPHRKRPSAEQFEKAGLDPEVELARRRIAEETRLRVVEAHKIPDLTERKLALSNIHVEYRAQLAALKQN